jgi:hypothetical protein
LNIVARSRSLPVPLGARHAENLALAVTRCKENDMAWLPAERPHGRPLVIREQNDDIGWSRLHHIEGQFQRDRGRRLCCRGWFVA